MNNTVKIALEDLQKELDRLAPAVDHISAARRVTEILEEVSGEQQRLVRELAEEHRNQVEETGTGLSAHAKELKTALEEHQQAISAAHGRLLQQLIQQHEDKVAENARKLSAHADQLRDSLTEYRVQTSNTQRELQTASQSFYDQLREETSSLNSTFLAEADELRQLREIIRTTQDKIASVDFPSRLDKLDATVAGIMASSQTTQNRVDLLERSLAEKVTTLAKTIEKFEETEKQRHESMQKRVNLFGILFSALAMIFLALAAYVLIIR